MRHKVWKACAPFPTPAWISPGGEFYPCRYGGHSEVADDIVYQIHGVTIEGDIYLGDHGWLKIYGGSGEGFVCCPTNGVTPPTQAQIDALWDLCSLVDTDDTKDFLGEVRRCMADLLSLLDDDQRRMG